MSTEKKFKIVQVANNSLEIQKNGRVLCCFDNETNQEGIESLCRLRAEYVLKCIEIAESTNQIMNKVKNEFKERFTP